MAEPVLSVREVTKAFGALKACDSVSFDLYPGEIHALIGPNGAGKSTLIRQIAGSLSPDSGAIRFEGRDIVPLDVAARARLGLGQTFQITSLAPDHTVLQNVVLGALGKAGGPFRFFRPALSDARLLESAKAALARVDLEDMCDVPVANLSHGQRRWLEIAAVLTLSSKVYLMDEPMAGLGADGSKTLTEFLGHLRSEAPILLVEHDMDAVFALADRITVLDYGRVIATGTVEAIRRDPQVRRAYLGGEPVP